MFSNKVRDEVMGTIIRAAFTTGLDRILLVAAIAAFVAGVVALADIRSRDFAQAARPALKKVLGSEAARTSGSFQTRGQTVRGARA